MEKGVITLLLFLSCACFLSVTATYPRTADPPYYTAAVFEHHRVGDHTKETLPEIAKKNLRYFETATRVAKSKGADIIVFPEYGLFPRISRNSMKTVLEAIPDPRNGTWNPCNQGPEFSKRPMLYTLSCMAKKYNIVLIANIGDIQPCSKNIYKSCPTDGVFHFNANVAFDRKGTILAKYHKERLFFEDGMDWPVHKQNPVFSTDFGTFAMFVCFDSLFRHMADTAKNNSIDAILLPTKWVDSSPQLASVLYWQSWATGNKINLLAANANFPSTGAVGSGIFTSNLGTLAYTYNPDGLSKLIVSRVPKKRDQGRPFPNPDASTVIIFENTTKPFHDDGKDIPEYCFFNNGQAAKQEYRCQQQVTSNFALKKLEKLVDNISACNNGMCCSLSYSARVLSQTYYLVVFNGTHGTGNRYSGCEEMCFVGRCEDSKNGVSCVNFPLRSSSYFYELKLKANFTTTSVYPFVVDSGMRFASVTEWGYSKDENKGKYAAQLWYRTLQRKSLLRAGFYGRCYDRDPPYV